MSDYIVKAMSDLYTNVSFGGGGGGQCASSNPRGIDPWVASYSSAVQGSRGQPNGGLTRSDMTNIVSAAGIVAGAGAGTIAGRVAVGVAVTISERLR